VCAIIVIGSVAFWNRQQIHQAQDAAERREFQQAERHLQQRVTLIQGNLAGDLLAAQVARRSGDIEEAARRVHLLVRRFGKDPRVALEEKLLALQQGDLQQAQELLAAHESDSSPEAARVLEAYIVGSLRNAKGAYLANETYEGSHFTAELVRTRRAIDRWLELRPGKADQVQGLVWSYQAHLFRHFLDQARLDIERALQLDPSHREARTMLAMHLAQEHPAESAVEWQKLNDEFPDNDMIRLNLADVRRRLGELEEAQLLLDRVLEGDATNVPALIGRGRIAMDLQELSAAEDWFRRACRQDPSSIEGNLALSRCLRAAGKVEEADRLHNKVEQLRAERARQREASISLTSP
jgi:tetratricopeptide (TPR) repeat protein